MTETFTNLIFPVIRQIVDFRDRVEGGDSPSLESERSTILSILEDSDQKARASTQLTHDFALAKHALVYWIDEVMLTSRWNSAAEWKERILEFEIFGKWEGGELFYEKAHEAERLAVTDPLEVFFLCASLGFQGRYAFDQPTFLNWIERVYQRITTGNLSSDKFLADDIVIPDPLTAMPGPSILLGVSLLVSVSILITLLGFIVSVHVSI